MYDLYYNLLHQTFPPSSVQVFCIDPESFCVRVEGYEDIYNWVRNGTISIVNIQHHPAINFSTVVKFHQTILSLKERKALKWNEWSDHFPYKYPIIYNWVMNTWHQRKKKELAKKNLSHLKGRNFCGNIFSRN